MSTPISANQNWAGNYTYSAARWHHPQTVEELQAIVQRSGKLRALGTRHSFNGIADSPEDIVSLAHFDKVIALDRELHTVTVEAGIRYGVLAQYLYQEGYALHNLASLPHISVAGAVATATHGSGDHNGNLATAVSALEMVTANGALVTLSRERDPAIFPGAVVALGALGVVTKLTLDIQPAYFVRQNVYRYLPFAQWEAHCDAITSSAYSVSLFTDWQSDSINMVWRKERVAVDDNSPAAPEWFGATLADRDMHPIAEISAEHCTPQQGIPGPWHERLPHFRMDFTPSNGEELQSEYLVPRQYALDALRTIACLKNQIGPLLQISEIRTIATDDLWLSPCYGQDCIGIHFTWIKDWPAVRELLPVLEKELAPFEARPHWGKLFTLSGAPLTALYSKLPDFVTLLSQYDPQGKFRNPFLDAFLP
jgi:xylitol oxidase